MYISRFSLNHHHLKASVYPLQCLGTGKQVEREEMRGQEMLGPDTEGLAIVKEVAEERLLLTHIQV